MTPPDFGNPRFFSFFQLVSLIDRLTDGGPRLGGTGPPAAERLRLRPEASFGSQTAPVSALDTIEEDPLRYLLTVSVFGLYGADCPLPDSYTRRVLPEELELPFHERRQNPVRDFLDIFNHRLLSLLYRSWLKYQVTAQYDVWHPGTSLPDYLFALLGLEAAEVRQTLSISPRRLLPCAGLFTQKPHSADSLARIVGEYFHLPIRVQECIGRWVDIGSEQRWALGSARGTLGRGVLLGTRFFIRDRFRVVIGPLTLARYTAFLPGQRGLNELREMTALFAPDGIECDVQLLILASEIRACRLLTGQDAQAPSKLGFTTWLGHTDAPVAPPPGATSILLSPYREGLPP